MKTNPLLAFLCICTILGLAIASPKNASTQPIDAAALLEFKSKSDLHNHLPFSPRTPHHFCKWDGVECSDSSIVKLVIENKNLGGIFAPDTLTKLSQLRVLSLQNNSLTGPIPDLSGLLNLKVLFLSHNYFSGNVPPSVSTLHRLKTLDLSSNMLSGPIPFSLNQLDRLYYLRLDFNRFNGTIPPFNFSSLQIFNVSHNDLSGPIPVTPTLSLFNTTSFDTNPGLCGQIVHKQCRSTKPFFSSEAPPPHAAASSLSQRAHPRAAVDSNGKNRKHKKVAMVIGLSVGLVVLSILLISLALKMRRKRERGLESESTKMPLSVNAEAVMRIEEDNNELEEKVKRVQEGKMVMGRSGSLAFCAGEVQVYTLDQLMRASAELLGRGTMGTTYKAVLDTRLIVTVKRLEGARLAGVSKEVFEEHLEAVGGLRHPTLVPLRAYFQAKEERLLVYDYQPNGSLSSLIHGSKSARAKPLHWTSCLKIAEDVAQGLSYIHQAWRLVHGNLKASNVLLGSDFEACLTDYCLVALASSPAADEDEDSIAYKAPEIRVFNPQQAQAKCDVYSFGVLLIELLTGKPPSQHPNLEPDDMMYWVRSIREEVGEENRSGMLLEVAMACRVILPDQRPTMWQVLKMIQEIKEVVLTEDGFLHDPRAS